MDHVVDKLVGQDGSTYIGTTRNGLPSGLGTCLWPDGSQYDGEWREGTMNGFGTYVWRSGQRYDGEWKDGLRDGIGIKTYADGSMYDGFWKDGKKHGLGVFRPAADEPNSRRHSQGWPSQPPAAAAAAASATAAAAAAVAGPEVADSGPPSPDPFARASLQQQQQQQQQEGEAHSSRGAEEAAGLEPPMELHRTLSDQPQQPSSLMPAAAVAAAAASPELAALRRTVAPMHPVPSNGSLANADSVPPAAAAAANVAAGAGPAKAPPAAGALGPAVSAAAAGGNTDAPLRLFVREYDLGTLMRQDALSAEEIRMIFGFLWSKKPNKVRRRVQRVLGRAPRMQKKLGEVVYKGHYSWELMIALQLGIRYSVGRPEHMSRPSTALKGSITATSSSRDAPAAPAAAAAAAPGTAGGVALVGGGPAGPPLPVPAFSAAVKFAFPSCGSSTTPAHPSKDFKWKDYAPGVFKRLRSAFAVDEAEYMLSLGGSTALRQLNSPGKSGSMFFLSEDERYLVKTMRKSEMKVLLEMLPKYYEHVTKYPQTLITRFFGLHRVTPTHAGSSVRFVVMSNIFPMDLLIHRRYDIKGSTEGRTVGNAAKVEGDPNVILKDLDIDMRLQLDGSSYHSLMSQLTADCQLLREVGVMDYSLLLGVHYPSRGPVQRSLADHGMSSDGGYDYHTAPASNHAARLLRATTSDDDSQSEGGGGGGGASRFSAAASAVASALAAPAAAAGPPSAAASQAPTDPLAATLLLTSAVAVGSPTHQQQQQQQQQQQAGSGLKPQLSSGAGAPAVQLAGPLESLPETQVVFAPHDSATASAAAGGVGTGTQELRVHRVTTDGEGGSTGVGQGARNWDVYTGQAELEERLGKILERMRKMNFSEQRMKDIAELARLKILGSKLKKSTARREPPSAVLQAIQQQRQEYQGSGSGAGPGGSTAGGVASGDGSSMAGLPLLQTQRTLMHLKSLRGAFTGLQDEEEEEGQAETPLAGAGSQELLPKVPSAPQPQLGINMPALAVPNGAPDKAEEVIVCFGIIDILQDYSARKLVERRVKTLTHDGDAVSVAPPKKYSKRFFDFVKEHVFAPPQAQAGGSSSAPTSTGGAPATVEAAAAAGAAPVAATPAVKEATAAPGAALRLPVAAQAVSGTAGTRVLSAGGVAAAATAAAGAAADANGLSPTMSAASSATGSGSPTSQQMPIALVVSGPAAGKEAVAGVPAVAAGTAPAAPTAAVQHPRQP